MKRMPSLNTVQSSPLRAFLRSRDYYREAHPGCGRDANTYALAVLYSALPLGTRSVDRSFALLQKATRRSPLSEGK